MWHDKVKIEKLNPGPERRILVVSDIHANLLYFEGALKKADYDPEQDELVIAGDFLEKGSDNLAVLEKIIAMVKEGHTHVLSGNCDTWAELFKWGAEADSRLLQYFRYRRSGLIWEMSKALGFDLMTTDELGPVKEKLFEAYLEHWRFLSDLPAVIESEHYIFAHSAVLPGKALEEHTGQEVMKTDRFYNLGYSFPKWVIVGHTPVCLYTEKLVCANPLIDRERKIISIDGGCVLKDDGQLNVLVIPFEGSEDFSWEYYDGFPEREVLDFQEESADSYYIRWGDNEVEVLERGEEFSHCRHLRTGYEMDILTKYLFTGDKVTHCNDCTDYVLPLRPGDRVSVVEECSRGYFVKHNGISGWYYGRLK